MKSWPVLFNVCVSFIFKSYHHQRITFFAYLRAFSIESTCWCWYLYLWLIFDLLLKLIVFTMIYNVIWLLVTYLVYFYIIALYFFVLVWKVAEKNVVGMWVWNNSIHEISWCWDFWWLWKTRTHTHIHVLLL